MENLDSGLFPGVSSSVMVHAGFANEHAITAPAILKEVKRLMSVKNTKNVVVVSPHFMNFDVHDVEPLA